jgi:acid phosphatase
MAIKIWISLSRTANSRPALGLFNNSAFSGTNNINGKMPLNTINYRRAWKGSNILQFLTNVAIEKMTFDGFGYESQEYWRVLVNESLQVLMGCSDGPGESCCAGYLMG